MVSQVCSSPFELLPFQFFTPVYPAPPFIIVSDLSLPVVFPRRASPPVLITLMSPGINSRARANSASHCAWYMYILRVHAHYISNEYPTLISRTLL